MKKLIGFAEKFYTLWDYSTAENWSTTSDGKHYLTSVTHQYNYIKNISFDLDKVKTLYPDVEICAELRGVTRSWDKSEKIDYPSAYFPFGKLVGNLISECNDVWQLNRTYLSGDARRKVLARKRLIELGELVRFDWVENVQISATYGVKVDGGFTDIFENADVKRKYITLANYEYEMRKKATEIENSKSVYLHNEGDKVTVTIQKISQFSFETQYGFCYIVTYNTENGDVYYYKGSSPMEMENDTFYTVKGTVKHNEYNGVKQTLLQRLKIA